MRRRTEIIKFSGITFCVGVFLTLIIPPTAAFIIGAAVLALSIGINS